MNTQHTEKKPEEKKEEKSVHALREERILDFWKESDIFNETLAKDSPRGEYVFYDGPPFATGEPHYGHVVPGTIKDIIPRYKTMQGFHVRRRWGWDCHGLPVENLIEKELGLASKKDILEYGIEKFNEKARESVLRYAEDWRRIIPRLGRFVDMNHDYRTMDASYTESVWWAFKALYDKDLIYEGFKIMQLCPRCETTLSNFEVTQGYKDITDISVYVRFELLEPLTLPDEKKAKGLIEAKTCLLAWTTTPWTLPGNVALAVHNDKEYLKVFLVGEEDTVVDGDEVQGKKIEYLIVAKDLVSKVFKDKPYTIAGSLFGRDLIGKKYKPVFDYYSESTLSNGKEAYKVYGADFVTTTDGTGIVHIAPAFGEDDYQLSLTYALPMIQHVSTDGRFKKEVTGLAGQYAKPKDDHQKGDVLIIKALAQRGVLFGKEKIIHSYPHCWRCSTPLLNYASSSWFVKVTDIKDKLVKENSGVDWIPEEVGSARFGNWLGGAHDWAISRSRFWGAPIPVWKCDSCKHIRVISSRKELLSDAKPRNTFLLMRHGEAENNMLAVVSSDPNRPHHLTLNGRKQIETGAQKLDTRNIDLIICSPFVRTRETAEIVRNVLKLSPEQVITDERLGEINGGEFDQKSMFEYHAFFDSYVERFTKRPKGGESQNDIKDRTGSFLFDIDATYEGKHILIITHDTPAWLLYSASQGLSPAEAMEIRKEGKFFIENGEVKEFEFIPFIKNKHFELDFHRPFIDKVALTCTCGSNMTRVSEVFDCWFESGSMPYAESHYPFESGEFQPKKKIFRKTIGFPADFIAEGLDQTRGWFYSMLVLGVALFGKSPFKSVIVNGLVLAEDGQKMSKSKKNYPDLSGVLNTFGADALRYYLMSSPLVHAQDFCFSEKGVDEVAKKHIGRLLNVLSFYEMYSKDVSDKGIPIFNSENSLDVWMKERLNELVREVSQNLDSHLIDSATRPIALFIDDLSTWFVRRSRDRFKSSVEIEKLESLSTTRYILVETAKVLAPFMPFVAEEIYGRLKSREMPLSVHLETWPTYTQKESPLVADMKALRALASSALELRSKAKINVRQPLSRLTVKSSKETLFLESNPALKHILKDEINVRDVVLDADQKDTLVLHTVLTKELKEEGISREFIRAVQELRKKNNLTIHETISIAVKTTPDIQRILEVYAPTIYKVTLSTDIEFGDTEGEKLTLEEGDIVFSIRVV